jgi:flagellar hook-length control protein FliK
MNSASILMNIASPPATGAQSTDAEGSRDGFSAALASLQEDPAVQKAAGAKEPTEASAEPDDDAQDGDAQDGDAQDDDARDVSALAIIASLLMQGPGAAADEAGSAAAAGEAGEAILLAKEGTSSTQEQAADAMAKAASTSADAQDSPVATAALRAAGTRNGAKPDAQDELEAASQSAVDGEAGAGDRLLLDKLQDAFATQSAPAANAGPAGATASATALGSASANAAPQSVAAAVHLATTLSREAPDASTSTPIREPVGSPRWAEAIGARLVLMTMRGQQEGSLTLTPDHLGPVEVQISVNKDTANVWFGAQHADTRAALADAMPRLRELLAGSGVSLGQSGVSEQTPRRAAADAMSGRSGGGAGAEIGGVTEVAAPAWRSLRSGLIDTYA